MKWANTAAAWTRSAPATVASSNLSLMAVNSNKKESNEDKINGIQQKPVCAIGNEST